MLDEILSKDAKISGGVVKNLESVNKGSPTLRYFLDVLCARLYSEIFDGENI